jgi:hypothetical protein
MKCLSSESDNFHFLTRTPKFYSSDDTWENESYQINLKDTSFDSVFCADSESVFSLRLKALFKFENRRIPPKTAMPPVKTIFLDEGKKREKRDV